MSSKTFNGIPVDFPYPKPYPAQIALMAKAMTSFTRQENAILESPTGTGKSLALLSSSLAYQEYIKANQTSPSDYADFDAKSSEGPKLPRIWFTSRTHTQLGQLVKELRKLKYTPSMSILASRSQTCINSQVLQNGKESIDRACKQIHGKLNQCPYGNQTSSGYIPKEFKKMTCTDERYLKFDIEDLKDYCKENGKCPYIVSKNLAKNAEIIFAPYNYIIDRSLREQMKIDLNGDIVIIDEAHNIEQTCRDGATLNLTLEDINHGVAWSHLNELQQQLYTELAPPYQSMNFLFQTFSDYVSKKRLEYINSGDRRPFVNEGDTKIALEQELKLTPSIWVSLHHDYEFILRADKKNKSDDETRIPHEAFVTLLQNVFRPLESLFDSCQKASDFRIVYQYDEDPDKDQLRILCMNPGVSFRPISHAAHSVILTSGTLTPISNIATELGTTFPILLSASHVIQPKQVKSFTISTSLRGDTLISTYRDIKNNGNKIFSGIGELLLKYLPIIPDGVLFFLPSYTLLNEMFKYWRTTNIYNQINEIKKIFYESSGPKSQNTFKKYIDHIRISGGQGAILFAVCRGKMSEGMDFSDRQARAVFVFGIPYPALKEADIVLKREYNDLKDKEQSIGRSVVESFGSSAKTYATGDEWYETQAFRSLFQAVGRCIRHKDDYGAILLIDKRFEEIFSKFPKWVQQSREGYSNFNDIAESLRRFYGEMSLAFPPKEEEDSNFGTPSTNAPFDLTCSQCTGSLFKNVMINPTSTCFMEKRGYLSVIKETKPLFIYSIRNNDAKTVDACVEQAQWCEDEGVAYKLIKCRKCDAIMGAQLYSGPFDRKDQIGSYMVVIDRLHASQKGKSVPLSKIVQKPKLMTLQTSDLGNSNQATLNFK